MRFDGATRSKFIKLPDLIKGVGANTQRLQLPKTGLAARLYLAIRGSIAGTLSAPNAYGKASIIRGVRLEANSGIAICNISGAGYHYLLRQVQQNESDVNPQSDARSAVATGAFNLDMVIPIALNQRDALGLIMLQSEQSIFTLYVDFEADSLVATGATVTCTVTPYLELFTVPSNREDWPRLDTVHQILEEDLLIPGAGQVTYPWPRGNRYLQVIHGLGFGPAGSDGFSGNVQVRINQSEYLMDCDAKFLDLYRPFTGFLQRLAGTIPLDYMGSAGMGVYDKTRDTIDSSKLTDLATILTATGAGTLKTIRRQLVTLG